MQRTLTDSQTYATTCVKIQTKDRGLQPLNYNRVQRDLTARARRTNRLLILKARRLGTTTWGAFDRVWFPTVTTPDYNSLIMAHTEELAEEILAKLDLALQEMPAKYKNYLGLETDTKYVKYFSKLRSRIDIGSFGVGRKGAGAKLGTTRQNFYGTEIADPRVEDDTLLRGIQNVPKTGAITFDSTPRGRIGWFPNECFRALRGESRFTLCFYPWHWEVEFALKPPKNFRPMDDEIELVGRLKLTPAQITWRRMKIDELGPELFRQEYPENPYDCFLFSGASAFSQIHLVEYAEKEPYCKTRTDTGGLAYYPSIRCSLERVDTEARGEGARQNLPRT